MKKLKGFLLCLLGCFMVVALSAGLFACSETGNQGNDGKDDGKTDKSTYRLSSISLDTGDAKTEYTIGDEFSAAGLKVTAGFVYDGGTASEDVTEDAVIDAANFNNKKTGTYAINIGYTFRGVTLYNNYRVNVTSDILGTIAGLELTYDGERQFAVPAKDAQTVPSIDLSKLTVNKITGTDASDTKSEALASGDYALSYSINGGQRAEVSGTSIPVSEAGTYSVFARAETSVGTENFTMEGFITFYAVDEVKSLAVSGGKTEFEYNTEETIGEDMTYTVTYASGATKVVPFGDASLTVEGIDNKATGTNTANVTYTETYLSFDSELGAAVSNTATATATFEYKIGENPDAGKQQTDSFGVTFEDAAKGWGGAADSVIAGTVYVDKDGVQGTTQTNGVISLISEGQAKYKDKEGTPESGSEPEGVTKFTKAIQMGTIGSSKAWVIDLSAYKDFEGAKAVITVYASTGSNGKARTIVLNTTTSKTDPIATSEQFTSDKTAYKTEWTVDANTIYYIGSNDSSINYFALYVDITYTSGTPETVDDFGVTFEDAAKGWGGAADSVIAGTVYVDKDGVQGTTQTNGVISLISEGQAKYKDKEGTPESGSEPEGVTKFTKAIQMGTIGSSKAWVIDLSAYKDFEGAKAVITVYASTGSNGKARTIVLNTTTSKTDPIATSEQFTSDKTAYKTEWTVDANTIYYIGSNDSSINYFALYVTVTYNTSGGGETESKDITLNMDAVYTKLGGKIGDKVDVTITDGTELVTDEISESGVTVIASEDSKVVLNESSKADAQGTKYPVRLKFGSGIDKNALQIEVEGAATITVAVRSSSGSEGRDVGIYTKTDDKYTLFGETQHLDVENTSGSGGDIVYIVTFNVSEAGTYYFGSASKGIGIYYISIEY